MDNDIGFQLTEMVWPAIVSHFVYMLRYFQTVVQITLQSDFTDLVRWSFSLVIQKACKFEFKTKDYHNFLEAMIETRTCF